MNPGSDGSRRTRKPSTWRALIAFTAIGVAMGACGDAPAEEPLSDLQVVGVDFGLNSIILTNGGSDDIITASVWIYQNGVSYMLDIFTIEPRDAIRFSVRELGLLDPSGGEIAIYAGDDFADEEAMIDYVAWGTGGHDRVDIATAGGKWTEDGTVEVPADTVVLLRADALLTGPDAWEASAEIP